MRSCTSATWMHASVITELILQLPQWLPGNHSPRGPINLIADISFEADGEPVAWTRDPVEV